MNNSFEKCQGCNSLTYSKSLGRYYCHSLVFQDIVINIIDCSCQNCLIKSMCSKACDVFYSSSPLGVILNEEVTYPFLKRKQGNAM